LLVRGSLVEREREREREIERERERKREKGGQMEGGRERERERASEREQEREREREREREICCWSAARLLRERERERVCKEPYFSCRVKSPMNRAKSPINRVKSPAVRAVAAQSCLVRRLFLGTDHGESPGLIFARHTCTRMALSRIHCVEW